MTADEAREETFTRREALAIVRNHNLDWDDFLSEVGNHQTYKGSDILDWLGY